MIITCTSDDKFIPIVYALISSILINSPNIRIIVRLVNCKQSSIDKIMSLSIDIEVILDNVPLCTKRKHTSSEGELLQDGILPGTEKTLTSFRGARWLYSEQMAYCSNIKVNTINKCLDKYNEPIIYIDADSIVRKDLSELEQIIEEYDISMLIDEPYSLQHTGSSRLKKQTLLYQGGLICVNNNASSRKFMQEWEQRISKEMLDWDADEGIFYEVLNDPEYSLSVGALDRTFKDEDIFDHESHIWSGSGNSKYCNEQYVNEFKKYS